MDINDFGTVHDSLRDTLTWTCQLIIDNKSVESAPQALIDLCKIGDTGSVIAANQDHLHPKEQATYRFSPLLFPGNEYEKIEMALKDASSNGGFKIIRPRPVNKSRSKYRGFEANFICTCGIVYNDKDLRHKKKFNVGDLSQTGIKTHTLQKCSKSRDKATMKKKVKVSLLGGNKKMRSKRTVTERPLSKDDLCPFKFTVFTDPGYKQCYLATPKKPSNDCNIKFGTHLQHTIQKECHMQPSTSQMSKDEEAFVYECSTLGLSKKQIHILLRNKSGKSYLPDTLNQVRHKIFQVLNGIKADESSAEKLMQYLEGRTDVTFVVLKDVAGTGLVATTGRGQPSNEEKKLVGRSTDDEVREAAMFPEVFGGDVTYKTNNEKRELFLLVGKDRHGKAFTGMRMFLPSGERWMGTQMNTFHYMTRSW
eukprot:scaffold421226_cov55-Attheya_sp.AAC.7